MRVPRDLKGLTRRSLSNLALSMSLRGVDATRGSERLRRRHAEKTLTIVASDPSPVVQPCSVGEGGSIGMVVPGEEQPIDDQGNRDPGCLDSEPRPSPDCDVFFSKST